MLLELDCAILVVMACIHLHYFIRKNNTSKNKVRPKILFDCGHGMSEGSWRKEAENLTSFLPLTQIAKRPSNYAEEIRQEFAEYFSGRYWSYSMASRFRMSILCKYLYLHINMNIAQKPFDELCIKH